MRKIFLFSLLATISYLSCAQNDAAIVNNKPGFPVSHLRYTDFHIHPTYKHYYRDFTNKTMKAILQHTRYFKEKDSLSIDDTLKDVKLNSYNWQKYDQAMRSKKRKALQNGEISDLRNYDQSGYPELKYVPGSILCNSYSPYEKQFSLKGLQRIVSHMLVTKMGLRRLKSYSQDHHNPLSDFLAEYRYNLIQDKEDTAVLDYPDHLYWQDGKKYTRQIKYISHIRMVRDGAELRDIISYNDSVFNLIEKSGFGNGQRGLFTIKTPMVMSVEGGQVLYDTIAGLKRNILRPFISLNKGQPQVPEGYEKTYTDSYETGNMIYKEILNAVDSIRSLQHRFFFITLGHFTQNHVVGFAKTLDRNPSAIEHRILTSFSTRTTPRGNKFFLFRWVNNLKKNFIDNNIVKDYEGFNTGCYIGDTVNKPNDIGFKVVEKFLTPDKKFGKPTYIDVKHMDILARIQYYAKRRELEKKYNIQIPIIASHFAVSGENMALARATGALFYPNGERVDKRYFDSHLELKKDILKYYAKRIKDLKNNEPKINQKSQRELTDSLQKRSFIVQAGFEKKTFTDFNSLFDSTAKPATFNSKDIVVDSAKAGWYNPWSINLFDEEIIEIYKSDGIIGMILDPRQLGAFMHKYSKDYRTNTKETFKGYAAAVPDAELTKLGLTGADLVPDEYMKAEPFLRNLFYIIHTIYKQKKAETSYESSGKNILRAKEVYQSFVQNDQAPTALKDAWETVVIGSDYDGLIDPLDFVPTASYIPLMRGRLTIYAYIFAQMHQKDFADPVTGAPLIQSMEESSRHMEQLFYSNGRNFILKYF